MSFKRQIELRDEENSKKGILRMIQVKDLTKQYGKRTAVDHISFEINDGEVVGFLGPNGAGKTTTMNMVCGYISSTSGEVKINGHDILKEPLEAKKCIGYLPEHPPLYSDMEVFEYLSFVYELKKVKGNKKEHIEEIMEKIGLSHVKDRVIKNLSKGYQQRVGFAQALIGNPEVLILDEPTVGLDPNQIVEIRKLIEELGKSHTVILSSHILAEIRAVCQKVIIIREGKIVAMDETENLIKKASSGNNFQLKAKNITLEKILEIEAVEDASEFGGEFEIQLKNIPDALAILSKALSEKGAVILGLNQIESNLEQVFSQLTEGKEDEK